MSEITIVTEKDLKTFIKLDQEVVDCIENAFAKLAEGNVVMPAILSMQIAEQNGEVDVKTAYVPGLDAFAIKVSPGFFDNPKIGLPSLNGMMILLSSKTGIVQAVLLDNGYLTSIRTAAAGAVAARHLAPKRVDVAGVLGAGEQAQLQIDALKLERDFNSLVVWARNTEKAEAFAEGMRKRLEVNVSVAKDPQEVVEQSQVVITTTPSAEPLIRAQWLHPGLHITAMGSDADHKGELEPEVLTAADIYVCDRQAQCAKLGELRTALSAGVIAADQKFPELGQVIAKAHPGRSTDTQITVCDLTGTGIQDTAIANLAFAKCQKHNTGYVITA